MIFIAKRLQGGGPTVRSHRWTRPKEPRPSSSNSTYSFTVCRPSLFLPHFTVYVNRQSHSTSSAACVVSRRVIHAQRWAHVARQTPRALFGLDLRCILTAPAPASLPS